MSVFDYPTRYMMCLVKTVIKMTLSGRSALPTSYLHFYNARFRFVSIRSLDERQWLDSSISPPRCRSTTWYWYSIQDFYNPGLLTALVCYVRVLLCASPSELGKRKPNTIVIVVNMSLRLVSRYCGRTPTGLKYGSCASQWTPWEDFLTKTAAFGAIFIYRSEFEVSVS